MILDTLLFFCLLFSSAFCLDSLAALQERRTSPKIAINNRGIAEVRYRDGNLSISRSLRAVENDDDWRLSRDDEQNYSRKNGFGYHGLTVGEIERINQVQFLETFLNTLKEEERTKKNSSAVVPKIQERLDKRQESGSSDWLDADWWDSVIGDVFGPEGLKEFNLAKADYTRKEPSVVKVEPHVETDPIEDLVRFLLETNANITSETIQLLSSVNNTSASTPNATSEDGGNLENSAKILENPNDVDAVLHEFFDHFGVSMPPEIFQTDNVKRKPPNLAAQHFGQVSGLTFGQADAENFRNFVNKLPPSHLNSLNFNPQQTFGRASTRGFYTNFKTPDEQFLTRPTSRPHAIPTAPSIFAPDFHRNKLERRPQKPLGVGVGQIIPASETGWDFQVIPSGAAGRDQIPSFNPNPQTILVRGSPESDTKPKPGKEQKSQEATVSKVLTVKDASQTHVKVESSESPKTPRPRSSTSRPPPKPKFPPQNAHAGFVQLITAPPPIIIQQTVPTERVSTRLPPTRKGTTEKIIPGSKLHRRGGLLFETILIGSVTGFIFIMVAAFAIVVVLWRKPRRQTFPESSLSSSSANSPKMETYASQSMPFVAERYLRAYYAVDSNAPPCASPQSHLDTSTAMMF